LFCDLDQRISDEIKIKIFDSASNKRLDNVDIFYYCGSYRNDCFIGSTDENGQLVAKFPLCVNGIIYTYKNEYSDFRSPFTVYGDHEKDLQFFLEPTKNVKVEVKKIDLQQYVKNYFETGSLDINDVVVDLNSNELVTISAFGSGFINYNYPDPTDRKIELASGKYNLTITLNGEVDIKKTVVNGKEIRPFKGKLLLSFLNLDWNILKNEIKDTVTFFALSDFNSSKLIFENFEEIDDPILTGDGSLSAELLYRCSQVNETEIYCSDNCTFVAADGILIDDFKDNNETCERAYDVTISRELYEPLIKPQFS